MCENPIMRSCEKFKMSKLKNTTLQMCGIRKCENSEIRKYKNTKFGKIENVKIRKCKNIKMDNAKIYNAIIRGFK